MSTHCPNSCPYCSEAAPRAGAVSGDEGSGGIPFPLSSIGWKPSGFRHKPERHRPFLLPVYTVAPVARADGKSAAAGVDDRKAADSAYAPRTGRSRRGGLAQRMAGQHDTSCDRGTWPWRFLSRATSRVRTGSPLAAESDKTVVAVHTASPCGRRTMKRLPWGMLGS